jgi:nitric oxide reductase large subunit
LNNSKGEARLKQFTVGLSFIEETSQTATISVSTVSIVLLAIRMGIGIKFYIDKVNKNNWMKILRKPFKKINNQQKSFYLKRKRWKMNWSNC